MKFTKVALGILMSVFVLASGAVAYAYDRDLQVGSSGADVSELQTYLVDNGFLNIPNGVAKGYFGNMTKTALMAYQRSIGLPAYGFFGPMTREKIGKNASTTTDSLTITSPNGGENWINGTTHSITWKSPKYVRATYVDIKLMPYIPPCPPTGACPAYALMSHTIMKGVNANQNFYTWKVGMVESFTDTFINDVSEIYTARDGQYTIQICETGGSICDYSDSVFTISTQTSADKAPVINGITAPTTLGVDQTGTWTIRASDPQNSALSYNIRWGDELPYLVPSGVSDSYGTFVQSALFTHSYAKAGTYNVAITVKNSSGLSTQNGVTVKVTDNGVQPKIIVVSPNGNEMWDMRSVQRIMWGTKDAPENAKVDIYAIPMVTCAVTANSTSDLSTIAPPNCGVPTVVLDKNIPINTIYNWIVGTDIVDKVMKQNVSYFMKICISGTDICDLSDGGFTINSYMLKTCPSLKVNNMMPAIYPSTSVASYFILDGERRELNEFDLDWVKMNCKVTEQNVY